MLFLDSLPLWALGLSAVGACILYAVAVSAVAHGAGWTFSVDDLGSATVLHGLVSMVYSVALGLIVINAQEIHTEVKRATVAEATKLADIYRDVEALDPAIRQPLRTHLRQYVASVVQDEWPRLRRGESSGATDEAFDDLSRVLMTFHPSTPEGLTVKRALIDDLDAASDARRERLFLGTEGINRAAWGVVILGAMVALGLAGLFPMQTRQRRLIVALTASMFGLMLFLIMATSPPLRGQIGVGPNAFIDIDADFDRHDAAR